MINETPSTGTGMPPIDINFNVNIVSNGQSFTSIHGSTGNNRYLYYDNTNVWTYNGMADIGTWTDQSYRTITLDEPATGDFLTWLQANAVKQ